MSTFNIKLTYTGRDPQDFMILVNPNQIVQGQGTIYHDYYPAAWFIYAFPGTDSDVPPPHVTRPFNLKLTTMIQEIVTGNVISSMVAKDVDKNLKDFKAVNSGNAYNLVKAEITQESTCSIINTADKALNVGIGDEDANPYLTLICKQGDLAEFVFTAELAICPVSNIRQSEKFKGDVRKPWISFQSVDVNNNNISLTYNGKTFSGDTPSDNIFENHTADQKVFG